MRGVALCLRREDVLPCGPNTLEGEQNVLSALLCSGITIDELKPLEAKHFYSVFNQRLFETLATTKSRDLDAVADALGGYGPIMEELEIIANCTPFVHPTRLHKDVIMIVDRWRERQLIQVMQKVDAELRVGALTVDGARARLREFFVGNAS